MPEGGRDAVKAEVEAVWETAAARDCRRALRPWLLVFNLSVLLSRTRIVRAGLNAPCRSPQRLQQVVWANPATAGIWGGVGVMHQSVSVTLHENAEATARKDPGSC